ncbi:MAG: DUF3592 domain-containing protein [Terriglobales bacterium]
MNDFWSKNWQWVVFAAFGLIGYLPMVLKWWRRHVAQEWPVTQGQIDGVDVSSNERKVFGLTIPKNNQGSKAQITYSYSWAGENFHGVYTREFGRDEEAWDFLRELEGKPVEVHVNRRKPEQSALSESSLETLLQGRAPAPPVPEGQVPSWLRPLLSPLMSLALVGFILSMWVHVQAISGRAPPTSLWMLHLGIFVVFIPTVLVAQKRVGKTNRKDFWTVVLRGAPEWMKYLLYACFGYAFVNFFWCLSKLPAGHHTGTTPREWRLMSGHWMVFYLASFAVVYATIASQPCSADGTVAAAPSGDHCANGHRIRKGELYCAVCGGARAY